MDEFRVRRALAALAVLAAGISVQPAQAMALAEPKARVGAFYFDGWAGPLSNFHFAGLLDGPFTGREPLYGWRDNTLGSMRAQLAWARQDGIRFFLFDWYYSPAAGNGPVNNAHDNYLRLRNHDGVGFALVYVNQDSFVIPRADWSWIANYWAAGDFRRPDYVRIHGKPLLMIIDERGFTLQMGGAAGVNHAISVLQKAAQRHGLPGVFVVGGKYLDWNTLFYDCFPSRCNDTDPAFVKEHYDAITQYGYPLAIEPQDGERTYDAFTGAEERIWAAIARHSPFPYIPSIMPGYDPRPIAQGLGPDASGYPWLLGHLFWTRGSPAQVAGVLRDGIDWANTHPRLRVGVPRSPPVVVVEAWNEISEGSWILPTEGDGYSYGEAIATTLGLSWTTAHARHITVNRIRRHVVYGTLRVADHWTACEVADLQLERQAGVNWSVVGAAVTRPGGSFAIRITTPPGRYRVMAPAASAYQQTCGDVLSRTFVLRH